MTRAFWKRLIAMPVAVCLWAQAADPARAEPLREPDGATAAVLPLVVEGELSEADRARLTEELLAGLQRGAFGVVEPASVGCDGPSCFAGVARESGASHVVRSRVVVKDRDFAVRVELFDGADGSRLAQTEEGCEICGIADAGNMMASAAAALRTKLDALAKGPSTLALQSEPEGAEVRVDGEVIGITPLQKPMVPGKRVVRISKEGFVAVEREVVLVEGVAENLTFELEKVPSRLPARPWGWVSLGSGVASLGAAVVFGVLGATEQPYRIGGSSGTDGCFRDSDDDGDCKFVWNTEWHALGLGVAGGALVTLGLAILVNSRSRAKREQRPTDTPEAAKTKRPRVQIGSGPALLRGRF